MFATRRRNESKQNGTKRQNGMEIADEFTCYDLTINERFVIAHLSQPVSPLPKNTNVCKLYIYMCTSYLWETDR